MPAEPTTRIEAPDEPAPDDSRTVCDFYRSSGIGLACTSEAVATFRWAGPPAPAVPAPTHRYCARHLALTIARSRAQGWPYEVTPDSDDAT